MPTYVYRREDGTTFEVQQRITEPALETCPDTGQPVKRVISANAGLIFKGSGFYLTDYARAGSGSGSEAPASTPASGSEGGTSKETASSDAPASGSAPSSSPSKTD